jgi:ubiquitin-like protein Pup
MAELKRKESRGTSTRQSENSDVARCSELSKKGEDLKKEMDTMLDEIDDLLEENAEEFVASYVQRGGE